MCRWGTTVEVEITIPSTLSFTGKDRKKLAKIDSCIAPIVRFLEENGVRMAASCCGHGKGVGHITLADGTDVEI